MIEPHALAGGRRRHRLAQRMLAETVNLGNGLLKLGRFLNHRIDTVLMTEIGREFASCLAEASIEDVSLVVTAETSGIAPALTTAQALGVPMVFARKKRPATMTGAYFTATAPSHTKGQRVELSIAAEYLAATDNVLLIDDVLGTGKTTRAMLELLRQSGCRVCATGFVLEKVYEHGRDAFNGLDIPVFTLGRLDMLREQLVLLGEVEGGGQEVGPVSAGRGRKDRGP
ncbi:xanthine phosphoribosyltransferase [Porticoccus sp.]